MPNQPRKLAKQAGTAAAATGNPAVKVAADVAIDAGDTFGVWKDLGEMLNLTVFWAILSLLLMFNVANPITWLNHARNIIEAIDRIPGVDLVPESPSDKITRLRRAIIRQESGGNFQAVNPHSGALGYGQLMPVNVGPWTQEALGKSLTSHEFLNDRDAQLQTIDHKLAEYWDEAAKVAQDEDEIVRRVAAKWYSGDPSLWDNPNPQTYNGADYPSIADYTQSVLQKYKRHGGDRPGGTFPLEGLDFTTATLTSEFGPRTHPVTGEYKPHHGVDFACEVGDAVVAWQGGTAELFTDPDGYGPNGVKIAHGNGSMSLYGHMSQTLVGDGDAVVAGDTIGLCGNQGKSSGPHLHFEIHEGDRPVDPIQYLK